MPLRRLHRVSYLGVLPWDWPVCLSHHYKTNDSWYTGFEGCAGTFGTAKRCLSGRTHHIFTCLLYQTYKPIHQGLVQHMRIIR